MKTLLGQPIDLITWHPPEFRKEKDYNIEFPVFTYGIPYLADVAAEGFIEGGFGFFADIELGLSTRGLLHQTPGNPSQDAAGWLLHRRQQARSQRK